MLTLYGNAIRWVELNEGDRIMKLLNWFGRRHRLPVARKIILEEISKFIEENRTEILRRATGRIRNITAEQTDVRDDGTKLP